MTEEVVLDRLRALPGEIGFYWKNLCTGEQFGFHQDALLQAASVIKLPVCAVILKLAEEGRADLQERLVCREEDKLPSCGALQHFPGDFEIDIETLLRLMITLSDNTATNLLLRRFGLETLNREFKSVGLERTRLERLLFDSDAAAHGLENRIVPEEIGLLLERIAKRTFVSSAVSEKLENLLAKQQIRHKIPGYLPRGVRVAHKTGEDRGITNDVGIVFAAQPFVFCFVSNDTDVPSAERCIRELALELYRICI